MNTTLASLVADVYTLTNRPDLAGETILAVRNATLKAHNSDFYYKDLFETGIQFALPQSQQTLEYKTLVPRWKALKYIRKYENNCPKEFLTVITPDELLDSYSINKENVCYVAGLELNIRSVAACQFFLLGCYVYPDVTQDTYSSWIAQEQPALILYEAASTVFKTIGYDEQQAAYQRLLADEYTQLRANNIQAVGY